MPPNSQYYFGRVVSFSSFLVLIRRFGIDVEKRGRVDVPLEEVNTLYKAPRISYILHREGDGGVVSLEGKTNRHSTQCFLIEAR